MGAVRKTRQPGQSSGVDARREGRGHTEQWVANRVKSFDEKEV